MRDTYSLNQLYHETNVLLEKYNCLNKEKSVAVSFNIEECKYGQPGLTTTVIIQYQDKSFKSSKDDLFASGTTPINALSEFEEKLQRKTNKALAVNCLTADFESEDDPINERLK